MDDWLWCLRTPVVAAVPVRQVLLTHAHPDHYGSAHQIALRMGAEVLGPRQEADVFAGHTPGQLAVWIPEPRTLIAADALASHDGHPIVGVFNIDPDQAARTALRLLELAPTQLCVGDGAPLSGDVRGMFGQAG